MIKAELVADSKNEFGNRITTMKVTFPRFILAELNTHRMFSRNSASSRAIPFKKMVKSIQENPFIPIAWQKNHKGMQGTEYLSPNVKVSLSQFISTYISLLQKKEKNTQEHRDLDNLIQEKVDIIKSILKDYSLVEKTILEWWLFARDRAVETASILYIFDVTKQLCNRLLEPFMWHTVIITATEWENFFYLRCPQYKVEISTREETSTKVFRSWKEICNETGNGERTIGASILERLRINKGQSEIHAMALAEAMWDAMNESTPKELKAGEWHIPFGDLIVDISDVIHKAPYKPEISNIKERIALLYKESLEAKIKIATARCARISYTVVGEEGKVPNYENDIKLHDKLAFMGHWSPFEHCAQAMTNKEYHVTHGAKAENPVGNGWSGNFKGFIQYRKTFKDENKTK